LLKFYFIFPKYRFILSKRCYIFCKRRFIFLKQRFIFVWYIPNSTLVYTYRLFGIYQTELWYIPNENKVAFWKNEMAFRENKTALWKNESRKEGLLAYLGQLQGRFLRTDALGKRDRMAFCSSLLRVIALISKYLSGKAEKQLSTK
jgi:hypothetical protein